MRLSKTVLGAAFILDWRRQATVSEQGRLTADDIANVVNIESDCRPGAIAVSLALREPKYQETAACCHFGRGPFAKDGRTYFKWENAKELSKYEPFDPRPSSDRAEGKQLPH